MKLYSKEYARDFMEDRVRHWNSLAGTKSYRLDSGQEKGVHCLDVWSGSGMQFTVVPDRGMNLCNLRYQGIPLDWDSGTGITSPYLYRPFGWGWLHSFNGGILYTCGLSNVGDPCEDETIFGFQEHYGAHGDIGNTPATDILIEKRYNENDPYVKISGQCRCISAQGDHLLLQRIIITKIGSNIIEISDTLRNEGFNRTPVFLLYHMNFGFPLLCRSTRLIMPQGTIWTKDKQPVSVDAFIEDPVDSAEEELFDVSFNEEMATIVVYNPDLGNKGLGVYLKYSQNVLPCMTLWKFFQKKSYVLALEPAICKVKGRIKELQESRGLFLDAEEEKVIRLEIGITEDIYCI